MVPRSLTAITAIEVGRPSAISVVPSIGSTATSQSGPSPLPAHLFAVVEHRRLVLLALADHDDAAHRHRREQLAHRVDRRAVAAVLVTAADPATGGQRRGLGDRTSSMARLRSGAWWVDSDMSRPPRACGERAGTVRFSHTPTSGMPDDIAGAPRHTARARPVARSRYRFSTGVTAHIWSPFVASVTDG